MEIPPAQGSRAQLDDSIDYFNLDAGGEIFPLQFPPKMLRPLLRYRRRFCQTGQHRMMIKESTHRQI